VSLQSSYRLLDGGPIDFAMMGPRLAEGGTVKELVLHRTFLPAVERFADKVAFHDGAYHGTLGQHGERVLRLGDAMRRQLGMASDDRYAVLAVNSHQYLELYHAGFLGAGVINPLNLRLAEQELRFILADSGTRAVFVDRFFADLLQRAIDGAGEKLALDHVVLIGDGELPGATAYEELVTAGEAVVPPEPDEDDPVVLMYTGGTTGTPKGVLLDHRAEMLNLYHIAMTWQLGPDRIYLHQTPMFHAASLGGVLGTPTTGAASVIVPMFDPGNVIATIEQYQVDWTVMVPTMIAMVLDHPDFRPERLASLTDLVYGASPMPAPLLDRILAALPATQLWQGYGMTECSSVLTVLTPEDHAKGGPRLRSAGRSVIGVSISVRDADGSAVPTGSTGEVCAKGGNFMREYWHRPETTEEVFAGGWYHTGDEGYLDEDGYLFLVDRVKDMIVTGGENVYSFEVENAIASHPDVAQVAVIGIPHPTWGEQVHAIVVPRPGTSPTPEDIQSHARQSIAGYKVPKSVELRAEPLPLSGALKPLKRELRRPYWEQQPAAAPADAAAPG
jgi:long-chain acyl-CoA synthetase